MTRPDDKKATRARGQEKNERDAQRFGWVVGMRDVLIRGEKAMSLQADILAVSFSVLVHMSHCRTTLRSDLSSPSSSATDAASSVAIFSIVSSCSRKLSVWCCRTTPNLQGEPAALSERAHQGAQRSEIHQAAHTHMHRQTETETERQRERERTEDGDAHHPRKTAAGTRD